MENYEDINAIFFEGDQVSGNKYSLKKIRIYQPIGNQTFRINPLSPFYLNRNENEILMGKKNGKFVPWWNIITGTYEEQMAEELKKEPGLY